MKKKEISKRLECAILKKQLNLIELFIVINKVNNDKIEENEKFINKRAKILLPFDKNLSHFPLYIKVQKKIIELLNNKKNNVIILKTKHFFCVEKSITILKKNYLKLEKLNFLLNNNYLVFFKSSQTL